MLILNADRVIIGDGKTVIDNGYVKLNDGVIVETGEKSGLRADGSDTVVTYDGCSILPGLFDLHVHFGNWWGLKDRQNYNDFLISLYASHNMKTALSKGVTTIRDVMGPDGLMESLKYAVKSNFIKAPRIFHTNQAVIVTGGHCWRSHGTAVIEADGADGVRRAVRLQIREGADFVKAMGNDGSQIDFTLEEMTALVSEAHRLGKKCCVHASIEESIDIAIKAGADTIEHGTFMTEKQAETMAKNGQIWVPTMTAYFYWADKAGSAAKNPDYDPEFLEYAVKKGPFFLKSVKAYAANLKKFYDMGVVIAAGSDNGVAEIDAEMKLMCRLGLSPLQAIECATSTSAKVCGIEDTVGKIAAGYCADMLVVNGSPLDDIAVISAVKEVYRNGESVWR